MPSLCWEFLRRNPAYRADYQRAVSAGGGLGRHWGLATPADPNLVADDAGVVWRPDVAPGLVVPLERASFGQLRALPSTAREVVFADGGQHIRLPSGLQLFVRGDAPTSGPLVVTLAYDADFNLRVRAVDALRRAAVTDMPPRSRLSIAQRERLARCLFALDASLKEHSYRDIAAGLFGGNEVDAAEFKTSSIRDVTIRLVRRGRNLMAGGYLKLLRAGF